MAGRPEGQEGRHSCELTNRCGSEGRGGLRAARRQGGLEGHQCLRAQIRALAQRVAHHKCGPVGRVCLRAWAEELT